jgi:hypothetical protein
MELRDGHDRDVTRAGWKSSTLKAGDRIKVVCNPLRSGDPSGRLVTVTLPDGRVLGQAGPLRCRRSLRPESVARYRLVRAAR